MHAHNSNVVQHLNWTELGDLMQLQSLQICPTFASFKFTEYDDTVDKVRTICTCTTCMCHCVETWGGGGGQGSNLLVNRKKLGW